MAKKSAPISLQDAVAAMRARTPGPRSVYVAGCAGAPTALFDALRDAGAPRDSGVEWYEGVWIPGIDTLDWAQVHATARARSIFAGPAWRESFAAGRFAFQPHTYAQTWRRYDRAGFDTAFAMVTPPDAAGVVSLGISADFSDAALANARLKIGLVNPQMPRPKDGVALPAAAFDLLADHDTPLPGFPETGLTPELEAIGGHVADLVEETGVSTLQFGLGKVQSAALAALAARPGKPLKLHAGMVSTPLLDLIEAGRVQEAPGAVTCGVALGTQALYARAASDRRFAFRSVGFTHAANTLARIKGLAAINSAIEVDLFGQANGEFLGARQVSGGGGLTDFLAGAQASPGGIAVLALNASAKGGAVSRIVPRLAAPAVTVARTLVDAVVTEYGIARLHGLDLDARARALIAIAAPAHRDVLSAAWDEMRRQM